MLNFTVSKEEVSYKVIVQIVQYGLKCKFINIAYFSKECQY
jgi:hypothetical protein